MIHYRAHAGDYSKPPPLVVRAVDEVTLSPWTWGWTSPPNASGEQESTVADGVPPDPLDTVTHDGSIDLVYPLPGWTFDARVAGSDARLPSEPLAEGDAVVRVDLTGAPDPAEIWIVGRAGPGNYELIVSFVAARTPSDGDQQLGGDSVAATLDAGRFGEELGTASVGPPIVDPQPWPIGTIYTDIEPGALVVDFVAPDPECVAAEVTASIGRGGAILVELIVEDDSPAGGCVGSAQANQVRVALSEPIGERRIYTSTITDVLPLADRRLA